MTFWVAGAAVVGGVIASSGAKSAASTQAGAANEATALQREQWLAQQQNQAPWLTAGTNALAQLTQGTGAGGNLLKPYAAPTSPYAGSETPFTLSAAQLQADPGYAFRLSEGQKALERTAAARGGLISGGALKAATRYGQDMGSQEYGNAFSRGSQEYQNAYNRYQTNQNVAFNQYQTGQSNQFNRLASMAGLGQTAVSQLGAAGQNYANQAGAGISAAGQATAAGQMGAANTWNNALGTMASTYQNQNNFNRWLAQQPGASGGWQQPSDNYLTNWTGG
jgi:hypothetical protein